MRYAIERHQMISDGDFVAVGLSGGKDSMCLLHLLHHFRKYGGISFELAAISVDPGFERIDGNSALDFKAAEEFCASLGVPLHIVKTDIADVVFNIRQEKSPCSLCANMRRGVLASTLNELGFGKLALGHHEGDLVTTFVMNLVYGGQIKALEPLSYLDRSGITVIRPLIYCKENSIVRYCTKHQIPVVKSPCPADKKTARKTAEDIATMLFKAGEHSERAVLRAVRSLIEPK